MTTQRNALDSANRKHNGYDSQVAQKECTHTRSCMPKYMPRWTLTQQQIHS